jgi:hypothetical protein
MNKLLKLGTILSAFAVTVSSISCNKVSDFGNTNINPAGANTPVTAALLTNVLSGLGGYTTSIRGGHYAQYFSETQYPGSSIYTAPILSFSGTYAAELYDLQNIINQNTDPATKGLVVGSGSTNNQIAIARILKAYIFWTITDRWGDIPYSEALQGLNKKFTPKYDTQQEIYVDLVKELKESVAQFDNVSVFKGDILMNYAASTSPATVNTKWKKFANSLRMLIALRTSKVYPNAGQWAATEFNAALADAGGIITTNTDNVALTYPSTTFPNPWHNTYVISSRFDDAESKTMTDALTAVNDPRIASFGTTSTGFPYGLDRPRAVLVPTGFAYVLKGSATPATDPVMILNAATVTLARAEAAERGWTTEVAATLYASAVNLSFTQFGYTATQATTYLAQPAVAYGINNLAKIGQQRWFALYPDGLQAWFEWRRTGFPALTPAPYATNPGGQIPRRYIYGTDEYSTNATNVGAAASRLTGGDNQDAKVWWDK